MATKKIVEQLVTELTADGAKMKKEFDKSLKDAKTWGDQVTKVAKTAAFGLAAGVASVAAGVGAAIKSTVDAGREIRNLSAVAGENAQEFQRIAFATKGYGIEQDKLADILKDTGDKVGDFLQNGAGPLKDFFENIGPLVGVTADEFRNLSGREALQLYVSSLEKANLSQSEMTFYMEAIASDATLLLPLLRNNGSELERLASKADNLGFVLSDIELDQLKLVDEQLTEFGGTVDGLVQKVALEALPAITELTVKLNDPATAQGLGALAEGFTIVGGVIVDAAVALGDFSMLLNRALNGPDPSNLREVNEEIQNIQEILNTPITGIESYFKSYFGREGRFNPLMPTRLAIKDREDLEASLKELLAIRDELMEDNPAPPIIEPPKNAPFDSGSIQTELTFLKEVAAEAKKMAAERERSQQKINDLYQSELDSLTKQAVLRSDSSELDRLRYEFEYGKLKDINAERQKQLESMATEIDLQQQIAVAVAEKAARNASLKEVEDLLKTEVERTNAAWDARVKIIENAGLSAEREAELVTQAEAKRAEELKAIHDQEMAELIARRQAQLAGAASLFGSLADLTEKFAGENSRIYKAMFIAEKAANIARAGVAIKTGIAEASSQPFPTNLAAMISVAAATSGLLSDIESINIAHGGLENVPKESTYLLDKGERVLSPKQNTDLTQFLDESRSGQGGMKVEIINNTGSGAFNASASMLNDQTLQIILTAVDTKLRQDLSAGRGVWRDGQHRYGWPTKGSI